MDSENITYRKTYEPNKNEYLLDQAEVENLYEWINSVPLSRPKRNVATDFSDGTLVAEIIHHYLPRIVDLHNYSPAHGIKQKIENWFLLNKRVLRKLDLDLTDDVIRTIAQGTKGAVVEKILMLLRQQIEKALGRQGRSRKEIDQLLSLDKDSKALAQVSKSTERQSPLKIMSPRKASKGEIPHGHPDRSTYLGDGKQPLYTPRLLIVPSSDNVARSFLEEKEMELLAKTETIKILNSKVRRLEQLLQLKEMRIEDLQSQLSQVQGYKSLERKYVVNI